MSPRKTRRGAKSEGVNETLSETMSRNEEEETPARILRTRRQLTKVSSLESDADQSPETNNKSRRKVAQETPTTKPTRSRKKATVETAVEEASSASAKPSTRRRTRRGKENDTISEETILLDSAAMDDSRADKSRGTRTRRKTVKKSNPKSDDESAEAAPAKKINASAATNVTIIESGIEVVASDDAAAPMSIEDIEVHQVSSAISRFKAAMSATPGKRSQRTAKLVSEEFTPESSPITVNLTPHRSSKTPRKSPMNLSSPKSHAESPLRLSKTPRKLPIAAESPVPSEKSATSSTNNTPVKSPINNKSLDTSSSKKKHRSSKSKTSPKKSEKVVPQRRFSKSPKIVLRSPKAKSSKGRSPSFVASKIKTPLKSKRATKSPVGSKKSPNATTPIGSIGKKSLSPKKLPSPIKSPSPKKLRSPIKSASPKKARKSTSPNRSLRLSSTAKPFDSPGSRMSLNLSRVDFPTPGPTSPASLSKNANQTVHSKEQLVQSPTVLLNKIPAASVNSPETITRSRKNTPVDESLKNTPITTQSDEKRTSQGGESPRRPKSVAKKRGPITETGTPLRPIGTPQVGSAVKPSAGKSIILSSSSTPVAIVRARLGSGGTAMSSSTPRERIRRSLHLSPSLGLTLGGINSPVNGATPAGSSTMIHEVRGKRRSFRLEDESNPLISEDESNPLISEDESAIEKTPAAVALAEETRLNGTYEVEATEVVAENEAEKTANGTYELAEPKTPNLRRKAAKRSLSEMDASLEERSVKRTCRVRFASPSLNESENKALATVVGRSRSATPAHPAVQQKIETARRVAAATSITGTDKSRRRSNSVSNVSLVKTPVTKRRSNSVVDGLVRSVTRKEQIASASRLSKPRLSISAASAKKQEVKTPIARKAPNFAQIHQRKFAKMESLVDAKKRVENRHVAMTTQIPSILSKAVKNVAPPKPATSGKTTTPSTAVNGAYNRYGFKLRKNDAIKMMTQKQPTHTSDKKQNENRALLKGVRTNRRFELIMKARNINQ